MPDRVICAVPFCSRSRKPCARYAEWICPEHWRLAPKRLKAVLFRVRRRRDRSAVRWRKLDDWIWARIKRAVVERAAGL